MYKTCCPLLPPSTFGTSPPHHTTCSRHVQQTRPPPSPPLCCHLQQSHCATLHPQPPSLLYHLPCSARNSACRHCHTGFALCSTSELRSTGQSIVSEISVLFLRRKERCTEPSRRPPATRTTSLHCSFFSLVNTNLALPPPPHHHGKVPPTDINKAIVRLAEPIALTSIFPYAWQLVKRFKVGSEEDASTYSGLLISSFALAEAVMGMYWGGLSDRIGRKPVLLVGCFGTMISMLVLGFSTNIWVALFGRIFGGALNGNIGVIQTMVAELVKKPEHVSCCIAPPDLASLLRGFPSLTYNRNVSATASQIRAAKCQ